MLTGNTSDLNTKPNFIIFLTLIETIVLATLTTVVVVHPLFTSSITYQLHMSGVPARLSLHVSYWTCRGSKGIHMWGAVLILAQEQEAAFM